MTGLQIKPYEWEKLEIKMGLKIPKSYTDLIDLFGDFSVDGLIYLYTPNEDDENNNIELNYKEVTSTYDMFHEEGFIEHPIEIRSAGEEGWFPFASTTNGDYMFCTETKILVVDGDFYEREELEYTVTEFIREYLQGNQHFKFNPYAEKGGEHEVYFYQQTVK